MFHIHFNFVIICLRRTKHHSTLHWYWHTNKRKWLLLHLMAPAHIGDSSPRLSHKSNFICRTLSGSDFFFCLADQWWELSRAEIKAQLRKITYYLSTHKVGKLKTSTMRMKQETEKVFEKINFFKGIFNKAIQKNIFATLVKIS